MKESTFFYKPPLVVASSKDNQTMKFDQLIEYNRKILLKNHRQNMAEKLFLDPFLKKSKLSFSDSIAFTVCFYFMLI